MDKNKDNNKNDLDEIDKILNDFYAEKGEKRSKKKEEQLTDLNFENNLENDTDNSANKIIKTNNKKRKSKLKEENSKKDKQNSKDFQNHKTKKDRFKDYFKSKGFKQLLTLIIAVIAIVGVSFGVYSLVNKNEKSFEKKYGVDIPDNVQSKFYKDYCENTNFYGELSIKGSNIDYKVYKGNNNKFYNSHNSLKQIDENGAVFVDYKCKKDSLSQNTIIYASNHYFENLEKMYSTVGAYKKNPIIEFNTIYEDSYWAVVGAFYTNTKKEYDSNYIFPYNTADMTDESLITFRDKLNSRFLYTTENEISIDKNMIMLSVDSDLFKSAKFVVVAVKTNSKKVNVDKASPMQSPHYPQIWYDEKEEQNPYRFTGKWYPTVFENESKEITTKLSIKDYE